MEEKLYIQKLIESKSGYAIEHYRDASIKDSHVPFDGTPKKHPHDSQFLILLSDPFSNNRAFYEFSLNSIGHIEDLGSIASEDGRTAYKIRVWVKKGMPAIKSEPFLV